jgi:dihydrofolate synthase/folylpolyglutamate synthase
MSVLPHNIEEWVVRLQQHPLPTIELKLERMQHFLGLLDNPQTRIPPIVHIAGTNGKGSTLAFLHSILNAAGSSAHRYTSPHLVRFNERFIVRDIQAEDALLLEGLHALAPYIDICPLTYFEATTVLAFHLFAHTHADFTLLEVGMGGRLDATNVIHAPSLTVITPISFDHQEFLGNSIADIAYEKACIMKEGVPCVVGRQTDEALQVIKAYAQSLHVPLMVYGEDFAIDIHSDGTWDYHAGAQHMHLPAPSLQGIHQYDNAAVAVACATQLGKVDHATIATGITRTHWQGRLQRLDAQAVECAFGISNPLYLDGGHNEAGAKAVAAWLKAQSQPYHVVMGVKADKDAALFIKLIAPYAASLTFIPLRDMPHHSPEILCSIAQQAGWHAHIAAHIAEAVTRIAATDTAPILVTGSLYLVGEVLSLL